MLNYGADVSNFTAPLDPGQLAYADANWQFGVIGLQRSGPAVAFQAQLRKQCRYYYVDLPGRDLGIPERGSIVPIDVEPGCFQSRADLDGAINAILQKNLEPAIYGNPTSIKPVIGDSTDYAGFKFWWANYGTPDLSRFVPFNGWTAPWMMQYSSAGVGLIAPTSLRATLRLQHAAWLSLHLDAPLGLAGIATINCDLDVMEVADPQPPEEDTVIERSTDGHFTHLLDATGFIVYRWGSTDGSSGSRQSRPRNGDINSPDHWEWLRTAPNGSTYWSLTEGD